MTDSPTPPPSSPARPRNQSWIGFLFAAFAVVGMTGLFATYAAPLPLERAMLRDTTLDEALEAARGQNAQVAVEALRPRLAESAAAILPPGADFVERVAKERVAMRQRFTEEAAVAGTRLRWLVGVVTVMAALFGVAVAGLAHRRHQHKG